MLRQLLRVFDARVIGHADDRDRLAVLSEPFEVIHHVINVLPIAGPPARCLVVAARAAFARKLPEREMTAFRHAPPVELGECLSAALGGCEGPRTSLSIALMVRSAIQSWHFLIHDHGLKLGFCWYPEHQGLSRLAIGNLAILAGVPDQIPSNIRLHHPFMQIPPFIRLYQPFGPAAFAFGHNEFSHFLSPSPSPLDPT